ncbi:MAG: hypothetical protein AAFY59_15630, partial [Pseudomonadota bacterium]
MSAQNVLAVDLDGTLIRSDMLLETWWTMLASDRAATLHALGVLRREGRAAFKKVLADGADVDIARLPYNREVLDLIARRKVEGDRIVLATASDAITSSKTPSSEATATATFTS